MYNFKFVPLFFLLTAIFGFKGYSQENASSNIKAIVSIVPQEFFVKRIGGDKVQVDILVKPGNSPATYQPTPRQMVALSEASLFFRIGVSFENTLLPKIENSFKNLKVIDTRKGIMLRNMEAHHHNEGDEEDENHEHHNRQEKDHNDIRGKDPHVWLSPELVKIQAKNITDALCEKDPASSDFYESNFAKFEAELDTLNEKLKTALAPYAGKTLMVFHPAWGYFAEAYGLKQQAIEVEGKEPKAKQLMKIINNAKNKNIKFIFVQKQFSQESAKAVANAIGATVVTIDPLASDYISNLENIAVIIKMSLGKQN